MSFSKSPVVSSKPQFGPRLIVIGAGAAGTFAALQAKQLNPELEVLLLEAAPKPLGKVKISGGGRCNVTNGCRDQTQFISHYPRGQKALPGVFTRFGPAQTIQWFKDHGVRLVQEPDGRMFPDSNESQTIIDCLLKAAQQSHIQLLTQSKVRRLVYHPELSLAFECVLDGQTLWAHQVVVSTGSHPPAYEWLKTLGHHIISPVPSLFTFVINDPRLAGLSGISFHHVEATLTLPVTPEREPGAKPSKPPKPIKQSGPLLVTHWGLSGPVVLKLSAWGARALFDSRYHGHLVVDFCPTMNQEELLQAFEAQAKNHPKGCIRNYPVCGFPQRFWEGLCSFCGIPEDQLWVQFSKAHRQAMLETLKRASFKISGKGVFKEEFVTAGGVSLKDIDMTTCQSKVVPGLYVVGELLDVDGLTGGFNFQNAWSSGWLAGSAIGQASLTLEP